MCRPPPVPHAACLRPSFPAPPVPQSGRSERCGFLPRSNVGGSSCCRRRRRRSKRGRSDAWHSRVSAAAAAAPFGGGPLFAALPGSALLRRSGWLQEPAQEIHFEKQVGLCAGRPPSSSPSNASCAGSGGQTDRKTDLPQKKGPAAVQLGKEDFAFVVVVQGCKSSSLPRCRELMLEVASAASACG